MNHNTVWPPLSCRTVGDLVSVYDLLSSRGLRSPRGSWSKYLRRWPHIADLVEDVRMEGKAQATPCVSADAWTAIVALLDGGDAAGDAAPSPVTLLAYSHEAPTCLSVTLPGDAADEEHGDVGDAALVTLPLSVTQDEIDRLMEMVETLRAERDGLSDFVDVLDDAQRHAADELVDVEELLADSISDKERAWWADCCAPRTVKVAPTTTKAETKVEAAPAVGVVLSDEAMRLLHGTGATPKQTTPTQMGEQAARALGKEMDEARRQRAKTPTKKVVLTPTLGTSSGGGSFAVALRNAAQQVIPGEGNKATPLLSAQGDAE